MAMHPKRKPRDGMDEYGRSPFTNAIIDQEYAQAKQLLAAGADINMQDDGGYTALSFVVQNRNVEMLEYLLAHGANSNIADKYNHTPLSRALYETQGNPDIDAEIMEMLLKHGAKIEPFIANEAKWVVDKRVILGGTMTPRKLAVIELLAKDFTDPIPPWEKSTK